MFLIDLQRGQPAGAEKVLDQAAKVPNTDADFCTGLARVTTPTWRDRHQSLEKAIAVNALPMLKRAEKIQPASAPLRLKLADSFYALGDKGSALRVYADPGR